MFNASKEGMSRQGWRVGGESKQILKSSGVRAHILETILRFSGSCFEKRKRILSLE